MSNVDKLPDCYAKGTYSNNYKLLKLNELAISDVKSDALAIYNMIDILQATGHTLDLYGDIVGQKRGTLNDTQYRYMILNKIGINVCQSTHATVINILKEMFNCDIKDIALKDDNEKTCSVNLAKFPIQILNSTGFTVNQVIEIIETLLPAGVGISLANFEGTFEFSDSAKEYDETAGFGDVEQTKGGKLGLLYTQS